MVCSIREYYFFSIIISSPIIIGCSTHFHIIFEVIFYSVIIPAYTF